MKKSILVGSLVAHLLSFGSAIPAFANGSGYNGPDLNPVSIPVQLDRGITVGGVARAMNTCLATGDPAHGLKSAVQKVLEQMGVQSPGYFAQWQVNAGNGLQGGGDDPSKRYSSFAWEARNPLALRIPSLNGDVHFEFATGFTSTGVHILEMYFSGISGFRLLTSSNYIFPAIKYDRTLPDSGFDDFGRQDNKREIVTGLSIVVDPQFRSNGAAVPLINLATQKATQFTINAQEYVQCLQVRLQAEAQ